MGWVVPIFKYKITKAGVGRSHIVVVTEDDHSLAFGWNKHGQLGSGSARNGRSHIVVVTEDDHSLAFGWNKHGQLGQVQQEMVKIEASPIRCLVSEVKSTACGANYTVWLSSVEGASILHGCIFIFIEFLNLLADNIQAFWLSIFSLDYDVNTENPKLNQ
ncbi:hypothetical protein Patl1_25763 [Pistacia atlantica]|uniref:Uncharacterized protein n=1 Tax=Pistacia atlantica TaxID=434234 RepID=A0ACC1B2X1_9ROSI|nr:hypothetical protein Patl1_25763 [Pistacia atlantica]